MNSIIRQRVKSALFFLFIFIAADYGLNYLLEPVGYSLFYNHILENAAKETGKIDMFFIGSSHTLRSMEPEIFEKELAIENIFNAGCGAQSIAASYYISKELVERYHPDYLALDINYARMSATSSTQGNLLTLDRLHGLNKLHFIRDVFKDKDALLRVFSRIYRFRDHLNFADIRENLTTKKLLIENHYETRVEEGEVYTKKGFSRSFLSEQFMYLGDIEISPSQFLPEQIEYVEKIIKLCEENQVQLVLYSVPLSMMVLYRQHGYQEVSNAFSQLASRHNISYHNLNFLRDRELWLPDSKMSDITHNNGEGADEVSFRYAQVLKRCFAGKSTDDLFYKNLDELKTDVHRIVAVGADVNIQDKIAYIRVSSKQNEDVTPLYSLSISADGETFTMVHDWTEDNSFTVPISEYNHIVFIKVTAKGNHGEGENSYIEKFEF